MMHPPIFQVISADATASDLLGDSVELRVYPAGEAPKEVARPYATWQVISGSPENYITNRPDIDMTTVQVDVWADTFGSVRESAAAIRYAIENECNIVGFRGEEKEDDTGLYHVSFDADWFVHRSP